MVVDNLGFPGTVDKDLRELRSGVVYIVLPSASGTLSPNIMIGASQINLWSGAAEHYGSYGFGLLLRRRHRAHEKHAELRPCRYFFGIHAKSRREVPRTATSLPELTSEYRDETRAEFVWGGGFSAAHEVPLHAA